MAKGGLEFAPAPLPDDLRREYLANGFQADVVPAALMVRNRQEFGALPAVLDGDVELRWRELIDLAGRFGACLRANGIGPGDVVMWQLPNWWESLVVAYGIWAAGAISSPVVPIYREFELRQVAEAVRPACVVTAASFRDVDHVALVADSCRAVGWQPTLRVVLRGAASGWVSFDDAVSGPPEFADDIDPDAPALIGWTSGTTSGAKGVVHSARSFIASPLRSARSFSYGWDDRSYMPAPVAHATGLLSAVAVPLYTGCSVVLRDRWDADLAIDDIRAYGVTFSAGAAVFIQELLAALAARGLDRLPLSTGYPCGGSTIPSALAEAADDAGMQPARSWGMTECPSVSQSGRFEPRAVRTGTDGRIAPGCEVRVVDAGGRDLPVGESGELLARGPQRTLGYLDPRHTAEAFDADGWFRTGDVGFVTEEATVTMTGRVKEIINRGGEKISGREIEDALVRHPAVAEAAVVPAPHPRLGEQPAAYVLSRPGYKPEREELAAFLRDAGLAPQKVPRVWRFVDELPRTASGKVKKYVLQAELAG
ncbi:MAG TPA: AMP-binding protein [Acidimicrobiales bacterium]|nr:AMP-binding protein [Acidimicrobiales bacterium]